MKGRKQVLREASGGVQLGQVDFLCFWKSLAPYFANFKE